MRGTKSRHPTSVNLLQSVTSPQRTGPARPGPPCAMGIAASQSERVSRNGGGGPKMWRRINKQKQIGRRAADLGSGRSQSFTFFRWLRGSHNCFLFLTSSGFLRLRCQTGSTLGWLPSEVTASHADGGRAFWECDLMDFFCNKGQRLRACRCKAVLQQRSPSFWADGILLPPPPRVTPTSTSGALSS